MSRLLTLLFALLPLFAYPDFSLRDQLNQASVGDYIVTMQGKCYTLLLIEDKTSHAITIEEITLPIAKLKSKNFSWSAWVEANAPNHTNWVRYSIDLTNAQMTSFYSFSKKSWYSVAEADSFLSKLLRLSLIKVPDSMRKKIGPKPASGAEDKRKLWQPQMIVAGKELSDVILTAWRTTWPNDGSELSGKVIELYLPEKSGNYPSYFPYWLEIYGTIGKAKVRIVDSGVALKSPQPLIEHTTL